MRSHMVHERLRGSHRRFEEEQISTDARRLVNERLCCTVADDEDLTAFAPVSTTFRGSHHSYVATHNLPRVCFPPDSPSNKRSARCPWRPRQALDPLSRHLLTGHGLPFTRTLTLVETHQTKHNTEYCCENVRVSLLFD